MSKSVTDGAKIGTYRIPKAISAGRGGMARVYRAEEPSTGRVVALKISRSDHGYIERNSRAIRFEADLLQDLHHQNIVHVLPIQHARMKMPVYYACASGLEGDPWYFVMEFLQGETLESYLRKHRFSERTAITIAHQIGNALIYLHEKKGRAHGDVKVDNIMFRESLRGGVVPEAVLIDFGVAVDAKKPDIKGIAIHTAAPEVIEVEKGIASSEKIAGHVTKMDVYSLGAVLYVMLTGHYPFDGPNVQKITDHILHETAPNPRKYRSDISSELNEIIMQCLIKEPEGRMGMSTLVRQLNHLLERL